MLRTTRRCVGFDGRGPLPIRGRVRRLAQFRAVAEQDAVRRRGGPPVRATMRIVWCGPISDA